MPKDRTHGSGVGGKPPARSLAALGLATLVLAGCVGGGGDGIASRMSMQPGAATAPTRSHSPDTINVESRVIAP